MHELSTSALCLTLAACGGGGDQGVSGARDPVVMVTTHPLECLARRLTQGAVEVSYPLPEGADPEFYKPSRETIARFQSARLILTNGGGFERWLGTASLPLSRVVDTSSSFTEQYLQHEELTHSHGAGGDHSHAGTDGHFWLEPRLATLQAECAAAAMSAAFPEHRQAIARGLNEVTEELARLDERLVACSAEGLVLLASHPAYDYLGRRHGWRVKNFDLDPMDPLSPDQIARLQAAAQGLHDPIMLWEGPPLEETRRLLEEQLGLRVLVYDPAENPGQAERAAGADFLTIQAANLGRLEAALGRAD